MAKGKRVNPILDRAQEHFESLEGQSIEVPEWGEDGEPLVVYFDPMTLREKTKLYKMAKNDDMALLAYALIFKATTSDGEKMFTIEDKVRIMNKVDPAVVARIAKRIIGADDDEDDFGKK